MISQEDLGIDDAVEDGISFFENALKKARHGSNKSGLFTVADDSGLVVPGLDYEPGIYSARWAGKNKDFNLAISRIEKKMYKNNFINKHSRQAFFCCALSIYFPDNKYRVFEGKKYGHVQFPPKGNNGFGYDPIFVPKGYIKSFGEMNFNYKEKISHRSIAFKKMRLFLKNYIY